MRIGIDVDNTITNSKEKVEELKRLGKFVVPDDYVNWDTDKKDKFLEPVLKEIWETCTIKKNCSEVIKKLRKDGHEIFIITYRNDSVINNVREILVDYLDKNDIIVDGIFNNITEKGKFCKENNIDLLIDDKLKNCINARKYSIDVLKFYNEYDKNTDFKEIYSWDEIYDYIKNNY